MIQNEIYKAFFLLDPTVLHTTTLGLFDAPKQI